MAQSFYGALVAVVKDDQGGVLPGVTVVVVNQSTGERREAVSTEDGSARFTNLVPGPYRRRSGAHGLPALGARGYRGQRPDHASHRRHAGARQPLGDADGHRPVAAAADAERVGRHDGRRPCRAGDAAERPQRAQPHLAGAVGGAAGRRRRQSDRQERLRRRQLPDWRRHGQPERVVLRRRARCRTPPTATSWC